MNRSTRVAAMMGAVSAVAILPAIAEAHTTAGSVSCALSSSNVPTIKTNVSAASFGASGNGGGGPNTVHYEIDIDGKATTGQFSFPGSSGATSVLSGSTAGNHSIEVYTQWS